MTPFITNSVDRDDCCDAEHSIMVRLLNEIRNHKISHKLRIGMVLAHGSLVLEATP